VKAVREPEARKFIEVEEKALEVSAFRTALRRAQRNAWTAARRIGEDSFGVRRRIPSRTAGLPRYD